VIVEGWAISDVGKQRSVNEDCNYVALDLGLFLVLDGMGGHRAGEVASRLAMETIVAFYREHAQISGNRPDIFESYDPSFTLPANLLRQAAFMANRVVLEKSLEREEFLGMGSTVVGMVVQDSMASMINVGDTRMYLIRGGRIEQISKDHTLAEDQVERPPPEGLIDQGGGAGEEEEAVDDSPHEDGSSPNDGIQVMGVRS